VIAGSLLAQTEVEDIRIFYSYARRVALGMPPNNGIQRTALRAAADARTVKYT